MARSRTWHTIGSLARGDQPHRAGQDAVLRGVFLALNAALPVTVPSRNHRRP